MTKYLLGLDVGTTTCRAAIYDLDGVRIVWAAQEGTVRYPRPRWAEVDPETWWQSSADVIRRALATAARRGITPDQIAGVGLTGLMHAPVLLDEAGQPVAPAMLWMDQRCAPQCEAMQREAEAIGVAGARRAGTSHSGPKLRWLAETKPEVLHRARSLLLPKDFVRFRLTGEGGTDPSDAGGTGMFDRERGDWDLAVVDLARAPHRLLPRIRPSDSLAGRVTAEAAACTGLATGTPAAIGGADTFCTRLGAGPFEPGDVCIYMGTAAWISMPGAGGGGGARTRGFGATSTTGAAFRWTRDLLLGNEGRTAKDELDPVVGDTSSVLRLSSGYERLTTAAAGVPAGTEGLYFLPHLMGERGPTAEPLAQGALVGLTLRHSRAHVARAVLEGTAFQLRRILEASAGLGTSEEGRAACGVVCGGAAHSPLWMQILADVTNLPLRTPAEVEAGVLGAAILAASAAGLLDVAAAQSRMTHSGPTYTPDPAAATTYDPLYRRYCGLDDLLMPWFRETPT